MNQKDIKKTIELTKKQYEALLKAVYLGNWMANACRTKDMKKDYESISDYIFSFAPQFDLKKYMDHEKSDGDRYYPTRIFEEGTDVNKLHDEYDEETFWDELADRLGERDFFEKYSKAEIEKMSREGFIKLYECIDVYGEELNKFGLERIRVKKKK